MNAKLMLEERHVLSENTFAELVVWIVNPPLPGSSHNFKYRLALVVNGNCVLRYDNEAGKGDHRHEGEEEMPYGFTSPESLIGDFWKDVQ